MTDRKQGQRGPDKKKRDRGTGGARPGAGQPRKHAQGRKQIAVPAELHARIAARAGAEGVSMWVVVERALDALGEQRR